VNWLVFVAMKLCLASKTILGYSNISKYDLQYGIFCTSLIFILFIYLLIYFIFYFLYIFYFMLFVVLNASAMASSSWVFDWIQSGPTGALTRPLALSLPTHSCKRWNYAREGRTMYAFRWFFMITPCSCFSFSLFHIIF
jgi:hypothetical protein